VQGDLKAYVKLVAVILMLVKGVDTHMKPVRQAVTEDKNLLIE
jgi:hypothetical protein